LVLCSNPQQEQLLPAWDEATLQQLLQQQEQQEPDAATAMDIPSASASALQWHAKMIALELPAVPAQQQLLQPHPATAAMLTASHDAADRQELQLHLQDTEQEQKEDQEQEQQLQLQQQQQQAEGYISSSTSRALLQSSSSTAPTLCGKLGTYTPNIDSATDRSMFGFAVSSSFDGSTVAVGAPLNSANVKSPGAAFALRSRSSQTCKYIHNPIGQPSGSFRYFGAQLALSDDASTLVVLDGVEGVKTANSQGNRPVVHVYRRLTNGTYRATGQLCMCTGGSPMALTGKAARHSWQVQRS
jgi:hypothetical protein